MKTKTFRLDLPNDAHKVEAFLHRICDGYHWDGTMINCEQKAVDIHGNPLFELTITVPIEENGDVHV